MVEKWEERDTLLQSDQELEVIANLPPNRQSVASEGEERRLGVMTIPSLDDEAIAPRGEGGWDESFAIPSYVSVRVER